MDSALGIIFGVLFVIALFAPFALGGARNVARVFGKRDIVGISDNLRYIFYGCMPLAGAFLIAMILALSLA